jgi:hypothetical protein
VAVLGVFSRPEILAERMAGLVLRDFWPPHFLADLPWRNVADCSVRWQEATGSKVLMVLNF